MTMSRNFLREIMRFLVAILNLHEASSLGSSIVVSSVKICEWALSLGGGTRVVDQGFLEFNTLVEMFYFLSCVIVQHSVGPWQVTCSKLLSLFLLLRATRRRFNAGREMLWLLCFPSRRRFVLLITCAHTINFELERPNIEKYLIDGFLRISERCARNATLVLWHVTQVGSLPVFVHLALALLWLSAGGWS